MTSAKPPGQTLEQYFESLLASLECLKGVVVSDGDGVPVIVKYEPELQAVVQSPTFSASFAQASEKTTKLGLGRHESTILLGNDHQFIHFNFAPLYCILIASAEGNSGRLLTLRSEIAARLHRYRQRIARLTTDSYFTDDSSYGAQDHAADYADQQAPKPYEPNTAYY
ncbi:Ragulator complex protein lamtor3 [Dimargaris verticillata]|uniref:Ragulator complex protein lamtor3 n=1 Tax=Dimargaris verticillata TaxID=2761393 RepID=A0A9W8B257_9FUNG|nr:Ragulator complex protein lamtor3 [Dimargaris verticillata]